MVGKGGNLGLEELHVIGKVTDGLSTALAGHQALSASLASSLFEPPVGNVTQDEEDDHNQNTSEHIISHRVLFKER